MTPRGGSSAASASKPAASNIQFAVNPADGRMIVIEMNPRVSRSSALASKATGFPIAKIAAKLALGYHLDEIPNDITRLTPASFEPTIDYVVVKIPAVELREVPRGRPTLTTQMKSVGEAMAIGRTFKEAFLKGIRSLELGSRSGRLFSPLGRRTTSSTRTALRKLGVPHDRRMWAVFEALERGWSPTTCTTRHEIDPWFLRQFRRDRGPAADGRAVGPRRPSAAICADAEACWLWRSRAVGLLGVPEATVREKRGSSSGIARPTSASTRARPSSSRSRRTCTGRSNRSASRSPTPKKKVVILGSGPNRIGQGIEFDYCCCHAAFALREEGFETVMINCNPETVSTDYDTTDRLYFEPLTFEDVMAVLDKERSAAATWRASCSSAVRRR